MGRCFKKRVSKIPVFKIQFTQISRLKFNYSVRLTQKRINKQMKEAPTTVDVSDVVPQRLVFVSANHKKQKKNTVQQKELLKF